MPLLLLFIGVPLIEIALFIQLGSILDLGWILLIVVLTAVLGTYLVRQQGRNVLAQLGQTFNELRDPTEPLAHGAMILFSGALLLTPGFFTDTIGFLLLVPPVREAVYRYIRSRVVVQGAGFSTHMHSQDETTIDTDYRDVSPETQPERKQQGPSGWTRH